MEKKNKFNIWVKIHKHVKGSGGGEGGFLVQFIGQQTEYIYSQNLGHILLVKNRNKVRINVSLLWGSIL